MSRCQNFWPVLYMGAHWPCVYIHVSESNLNNNKVLLLWMFCLETIKNAVVINMVMGEQILALKYSAQAL